MHSLSFCLCQPTPGCSGPPSYYTDLPHTFPLGPPPWQCRYSVSNWTNQASSTMCHNCDTQITMDKNNNEIFTPCLPHSLISLTRTLSLSLSTRIFLSSSLPLLFPTPEGSYSPFSLYPFHLNRSPLIQKPHTTFRSCFHPCLTHDFWTPCCAMVSPSNYENYVLMHVYVD